MDVISLELPPKKKKFENTPLFSWYEQTAGL